ncbi:MAG: NUDIX domain-containing protein [Methylobacteriaceae bacterium]|nr:NUDIX domain-containing protein [Methylobacteriaceae bacterium]MBV9244259.1 NUDIX domain-containing protein [Methylobacteriaceae bacterium]
MTAIRKACPVVLRRGRRGPEILVFGHPTAGTQLVKGTVEDGEEPASAALRELREESGIAHAVVEAFLGILRSEEAPGEEWHVFLCRTEPLPDTWRHLAEDDCGHEFSFFWHPLDEAPGEDWHPIFRRALDFIRAGLRTSSPGHGQ